MKIFSFTSNLALGFVLTMILSLSVSNDASAIPAFARQTGFNCTVCHFQHFPVLNAFGRNFKANGYTLVGGEQAKSLVKGDLLSLPSVLNGSLVLKTRYQKTNGDEEGGTNAGELQFPDEAAFFLGGRVGDFMGFVLEGQMADPEGAFFASFKIPFAFDVGNFKLGVVPFTTDALGVSFGYELLNTGAVRNVRTFEHRKDISAQQFLGTASEATGFAFTGSHQEFGFFNFTKWAPVHGGTDGGLDLTYFRLGLYQNIQNWELAGGIQLWGGTYTIGNDDINQASAWSVDLQGQSTLGKFPLGLYFTYGSAAKTDGVENLFNSSQIGDKKAYSFTVELGVVPNRWTLGLGYLGSSVTDDNTNARNGLTFASTYLLRQNIMLQLNHTTRSGSYYDVARSNGDRLTTLMLFTSF